MHGTDDDSVPVLDTLRLASSGSTDLVQLIVEPGDDHRLSRSIAKAEDMEALVDKVLKLNKLKK